MKICGLLFVATAGACAMAPPPVRPEIAILEAGDATLRSVDGTLIKSGSKGAFELRPGGHTFEISAISFRPSGHILPIEIPVLVSMCVKAKGGRRYRIKTADVQGRPRVFVIDTATGAPPKTPCGPDEDDD